jgi:hypothetical protein
MRFRTIKKHATKSSAHQTVNFTIKKALLHEIRGLATRSAVTIRPGMRTPVRPTIRQVASLRHP